MYTIMQSAQERLHERFRRVMPQLVRIGATVDVGPPPPGTFRFLTHTWGSKPMSPFFRDLDSYDHTFGELLALREKYKSSLLQIIFPNALRDYDEGMHKELHIRRLVRKWIGNLRRRIMLKKGVNEEDLYTTVAIPDGARVRVCDYASRRFYDFHVTTLLHTVSSSLFFNNWGIPDPQMPKNPYTNLVWNTGQLVSIVQQIVSCLNRTNRIVPSHVAQLRNARYDISRFHDDNILALRIHSAYEYLKNLNDPDSLDSYIESMNDLYDSCYEAYTNQTLMRRLVVNRKLPADLLKRWDKLIVDNWIYINHLHIMNPWKTFDEMMDEFIELHTKSTQWWSTQPRRILRRPTNLVQQPPTPAPRRSVFVFGFNAQPSIVHENAIVVRLPDSAGSSMEIENDSEE